MLFSLCASFSTAGFIVFADFDHKDSLVESDNSQFRHFATLARIAGTSEGLLIKSLTTVYGCAKKFASANRMQNIFQYAVCRCLDKRQTGRSTLSFIRPEIL